MCFRTHSPAAICSLGALSEAAVPSLMRKLPGTPEPGPSTSGFVTVADGRFHLE